MLDLESSYMSIVGLYLFCHQRLSKICEYLFIDNFFIKKIEILYSSFISFFSYTHLN